MRKYIPAEIEAKWQKKWQEEDLYQVNWSKPGKKKYILIEFSYPSGDLHMGHWFAFAVPDILVRASRMQGYNVFFPNGFDAFGLPAENAAIKKGIHPQDWTLSNIEKMKGQFATMGASFNWENEVITCLPEYYKWNQWIFLKMFEKGLAYKGQKSSNWCPSCQTVLANENVEDGKCWRCGTIVEQKQVSQWFLKITEYAERLLWKEKSEGPAEGGTTSIDWPKPVREGQNNWIGKSEGMEIRFKIEDLRLKNEGIIVYTVFPETIFGVTYLVLAPEYPEVENLVTKDQEKTVKEYIKKSKDKSEIERKTLDKEKTGVFTGSYCINPVNGKEIPIWIADYVLSGYGTGAVMGVPGSDDRDYEFAKKYNLEIIRVIGKNVDDHSKIESANDVLEQGWLVNSSQFNGLATPEPGREKVKDFLEQEGFGKRKTQYHLHDWSISRQRYWGTPIPIIYCSNCCKGKREKGKGKAEIAIIDGKEYAMIPVPEKDLPVELPYKVDYAPKGKPPLATAEEWVKVTCPSCGGQARREVETMDTFVDSSWYFFRYLDPKNDEEIFDKSIVKKWLPIDIYFGGAEHTLGHTLYSRFFTKFLYDYGLSPVEEYAQKRVNRGLILGPDGQKMSKSRGNVINPDDQVKDYGADAVRLYLAFIGPYAETVTPWDNAGVAGVFRFLQRVWELQEKVDSRFPPTGSPRSGEAGEAGKNQESRENSSSLTLATSDLRMMHKTIKKVTEQIFDIKFNTAIASMMEWLNYLSKKAEVSLVEFKTLLLLLAPFAPHMTEELWQIINGQFTIDNGQLKKISNLKSQISNVWSIHQQLLPSFDNKYLEESQMKVAIQINGKVRASLLIQKDIMNNKEVIEKLALENERAQKFIAGKSVEKTVYIPGKIISLVLSS